MVNLVPHTLKEALDYREKGNVIPYAGGTDLMIDAEQEIPYLFLHAVAEMKQITEDNDAIHIGAACTFTQIGRNTLCPPLLRDAIKELAAPAIRNMGTIGGNIGNGSPKADSALVLYAMHASVRLASAKGERIVPIREFYLGRKKLDLRDDELIIEMIIPKKANVDYFYEKVGAREALAISRVAFAGLIRIENNVISYFSTAFGSVADTIIGRSDIDAMMIGKTMEEAKSIRQTYLDEYDKAIVPIRGRVSETYRKQVCANLLNEFLKTYGI